MIRTRVSRSPYRKDYAFPSILREADIVRSHKMIGMMAGGIYATGSSVRAESLRRQQKDRVRVYIRYVDESSAIFGRTVFESAMFNSPSKHWIDDDAIKHLRFDKLPAIMSLDISSAAGTEKRARLPGPIKFLTRLLDTWHLERTDAVRLLGLDEESDMRYVSDLLEGREPLQYDTASSERIAQLFRIRKMLFSLFRDEDAENGWLRQPLDILGRKTPMELLLEGNREGMVSVKEVLEVASGR